MTSRHFIRDEKDRLIRPSGRARARVLVAVWFQEWGVPVLVSLEAPAKSFVLRRWPNFYFSRPHSCLGIRRLATRLSAKDMPRRKGGRAGPQGAGRWYFPSCQDCSIKRTHLAHPTYTNADVLRVGGGCTGEESRCNAKQGCCGKTALVWILDPTLVRFLDLVQDWAGQSNFGNHGGCYFLIAQGCAGRSNSTNFLGLFVFQASLVCGRLVDIVDHDEFERLFLRIELETQRLNRRGKAMALSLSLPPNSELVGIITVKSKRPFR